GRLLAEWSVSSAVCAELAFRPDSRALGVLTPDGAALFEVGGRDFQNIDAIHSNTLRTFAFHPSGEVLACIAEEMEGNDAVWALTWLPFAKAGGRAQEIARLPR